MTNEQQVRAFRDHERGSGVPKVVDSQIVWYVGFQHSGPPHARVEIGVPKGAVVRTGENESVGVVLSLPVEVLCEHLHEESGDVDPA